MDILSKIAAMVRRYFDPNQARDKYGKWTSEGTQHDFHADKAEKATDAQSKRRHLATALAAAAHAALNSGDKATAQAHIDNLDKVVTALRVQVHHSKKSGKADDHPEVKDRQAAYEHYRALLGGLKAHAKGKGDLPDVHHFHGSDAQAPGKPIEPPAAPAPEPSPTPEPAKAPEPEPEPATPPVAEPTPATTYVSDPVEHGVQSAALMQEHTTLTMRGAGQQEVSNALSLSMAHHWAGVATNALADGKLTKAKAAHQMLVNHLSALDETNPAHEQHAANLDAVQMALAHQLGINTPAPEPAPPTAEEKVEQHLKMSEGDVANATPGTHHDIAADLHALKQEALAGGDTKAASLLGSLGVAHNTLAAAKTAAAAGDGVLAHVNLLGAAQIIMEHNSADYLNGLGQDAKMHHAALLANTLEMHKAAHGITGDQMTPEDAWTMSQHYHGTPDFAQGSLGKVWSQLGLAGDDLKSGNHAAAQSGVDLAADHLKQAEANAQAGGGTLNPLHVKWAKEHLAHLSDQLKPQGKSLEESGLKSILGDKMTEGHHNRVANMLNGAKKGEGGAKKDGLNALENAHSVLAELKSSSGAYHNPDGSLNAKGAALTTKIADHLLEARNAGALHDPQLAPYYTAAADAVRDVQGTAKGAYDNLKNAKWDAQLHEDTADQLTGLALKYPPGAHGGAIGKVISAHDMLASAYEHLNKGNVSLAQDALNGAHAHLSAIQAGPKLPKWLEAHLGAALGSAAKLGNSTKPAPAPQPVTPAAPTYTPPRGCPFRSTRTWRARASASRLPTRAGLPR